ncbi:MAG: DUF1217 domain-containing protein [Pseudomonadota bacterium]
MTFAPIIPLGGFAGWSFLNRTRDQQEATFVAQPQLSRETAYFAENIGSVTSAADLVADRQLLKVTLGAFGLGDDLNNRAFIQKVLEEGTLDSDAFANRLTDTRYREMSAAFGFGDLGTPNTQISTFPDEIISAYQTQEFEIAVGNQSSDMRLALTLEREIGDLASNTSNTEGGKWFLIMGNEPLRTVFQTALGLPTDIASIDVEKQRELFENKALSVFGDKSVAQFSDPDKQEELIRRFFALGEVASTNAAIQSGASAALFLLQN